MSTRSDLLQAADSTDLSLDRPVLIAVIVGCAAAALMVLMATANSAGLGVDEIAAESAAQPTPYSEMHSRIPASAQDEEQPPTF